MHYMKKMVIYSLYTKNPILTASLLLFSNTYDIIEEEQIAHNTFYDDKDDDDFCIPWSSVNCCVIFRNV